LPKNIPTLCQNLSQPSIRPLVKGKFIFVGSEKFYVRGVAYGPFRPDENGNFYHNSDIVERDFARIAANGMNAIRTYTVPPRWLLDIAQRYGLRVMIGLPWEQHIAFLDDKKRVQAIVEKVRAGVRVCAGHPSVLCYAIGNEIPAPIVRWHGRRPTERFIERLYQAAKAEDRDGLVTYVNYPTTEYLQLPFVDFVCFNVYLESQERLEAYLARLQNIAGDRPLVITEIGLDSSRNGEDTQARVLNWQIRTTFAAGCAGAFVFTWTDEWHRGGYDIEDWDFGLTKRDRCPKPALGAVCKAFTEVPFAKGVRWPRISVVVCSCNGERTIRDCFEGLQKLSYPNFEVIVVDDGSNDSTAVIASEYGFRLIRTENRGLSSARNTGLEAATGEIVAYTDDDARPDPHWLTYIASTFMSTTHAGVGGPNIPPFGDGSIAQCVANAPGGPTHVLLSDREAEHIPGCNMAFRRSCLKEIGGFDPQFRVAGDDVDVCWRLQERGWTLGFSPAAIVWHHRRNSVRAYWRQQLSYGKAEALLERKWPEKYNTFGHLTWKGRLYGNGYTHALPFGRWRVYYGVWGNRLFQSIYAPAQGFLRSLLLMPEWYLVIIIIAVLSIFGILWTPLLFALPLLPLAVGAPLAQAVLSASHASFSSAPQSLIDQLKLRSLTAILHMLQPLARLCGRLRHRLTPWRQHGVPYFALPWPRTTMVWNERWQAPEERLQHIEAALRADGAIILRGGNYDRWDLEVRGGLFGAVRMRMAVEEHGAGKQLVRIRSWPRFSPLWLALTLLFTALYIIAIINQAWPALVLGLAAGLLASRALEDCGDATASYLYVFKQEGGDVRYASRAQSIPKPMQNANLQLGRVAPNADFE
jgi:GT2 family glycosyltransferase